jgi:predicted RNA-binding Zn-ribbon protein involved in translation (DUF1610 family)
MTEVEKPSWFTCRNCGESAEVLVQVKTARKEKTSLEFWCFECVYNGVPLKRRQS